MSIKSRIGRLEQEKGGPEATILMHRTLYEGREGNIEGENTRAVIIWGYLRTALAGCEDGESFEAFKDRIRAYAKLTWAEAQKLDDLVFPQGRADDRKVSTP